MISTRIGAIGAAVAAVLASAAPASAACKVWGVESFNLDGSSDIRMAARAGRPCTVRHSTILIGGPRLRILPTRVMSVDYGPQRGRIGWRGNRLTYRGVGHDHFGYEITDRSGWDHDIDVRVDAR